jgi:hypothetical protein
MPEFAQKLGIKNRQPLQKLGQKNQAPLEKLGNKNCCQCGCKENTVPIPVTTNPTYNGR